MAAALDLKSSGETRAGSTPASGTPMIKATRAQVGRLLPLTGSRFLVNHRQDVPLGKNQVFLAVILELGARVLREDDAVAFLQVEGRTLAVFEQPAVTHRNYLALLRFFLRGVGQNQPASCHLFSLDRFNYNPV